MPELPEVETIVRGLAPRLFHRRIAGVELRQPRVVVGDVGRAAGYQITSVTRRGKHIIFELEKKGRKARLLIHLGMTGQLVMDAAPGRHTHAIFSLEGAPPLLYNDTRQFGRLQLTEQLPARLSRLGPDPFEVGEEEFVRRFRARRAMAKALLLNQAFLSGLGNIYTDEALFRARIHPRAISSRLRPARVAALYRAILEVLEESIRLGGTSVSDYVSSDGRRGRFQLRLKVYRRSGQPCPLCGALIRRILVASRGTHFCPQCQKPPAPR
ncbi:MAG: bifunctional DNA-formamidopyrimidine glycosylase/DNA-(apurinic or apyrimidinic site) lyase [Acidobacteria bacterium]|nr:bifunctional DNA-formamidopyrimidine glycosylase/DNA-(apurinic or apyrimidinic site) lyase [Acidobacteriota bacterium]